MLILKGTDKFEYKVELFLDTSVTIPVLLLDMSMSAEFRKTAIF